MKTKNFKTIEQVIKEGNSITNQKIKEKFVGREIYCNVGSLVEYILRAGFEDRNAPFTIDDIENLYSYPEYRGTIANFEGGTEDERQAEIDRLRDLAEGDNDNTAKIDFNDLGILEAEIEELEQLETETQEVYEWWAVSSYLYGKLKDLGHPVIDAGSCYVWGRCTTGQAILLDYAITKICADMGILEGQENEWTV